MRTVPLSKAMLGCMSPPFLTMRTLSQTPLRSSLPSFSSPNPNPKTSQIPRTPTDLRFSQSTMTLSGPTNPISVPSATRISEPEFDVDNDYSDSSKGLVVVSFYKFADFHDHACLRQPLRELCEDLRVSGGIILAPEGINGSICGTRDSVERILEFVQSDNRLKGLRRVESPVGPEEEAIHHGHAKASPLAAGEDAPFRWDHVRVKLKKEIVTLGMPSVSPIERVGKYVGPLEWNTLLNDPDTVVIDVRNGYETRIGRFKGAVDPCTAAFREFPSWVDDQFQVDNPNKENLEEAVTDTDTGSPKKKMPPKVAMYCTGGIRCEKASSFLLSKGFKEVYHLEGGILKYLEDVPKTESLWEGECFVFDKRVSVEHGLVQGTHKLCYGCKQPVSDADMESPDWELGVSCPYCHSSKSEDEKERARARQRQFKTWGVIGGPHGGRRPPVSVSEDVNVKVKRRTRLSSSA